MSFISITNFPISNNYTLHIVPSGGCEEDRRVLGNFVAGLSRFAGTFFASASLI